MSSLVCSGVQLRCTCGQGISKLIVPNRRLVHPVYGPFATILDNQPVVNITPFSRCNAPPVVARAQLSGIPPLCLPKPTGFWAEAALGVTFGTARVLASDSHLNCVEGGVLTIQTSQTNGVSYTSSFKPPSN